NPMSRAPTPRLLATIFTRRSGWGKGSERNNTAFTMLKIAVFAPTPKARESTATIVKPGLFRSARSAYRISCNNVVIKTPRVASPGCQRLFLLRPWRYDTVGARIGDRLAEVLVLVPEKEADRIFLGHIPAEQFHRRLQVGVRESLDGFLQVCVGGLQRFLQFFRLDDLCSAPVAPAPTRAGKRSYEQAVLHHDQVEDVASGTHTLTGLPVVFPAMTRARPANLSDSVPASLDRAA